MTGTGTQTQTWTTWVTTIALLVLRTGELKNQRTTLCVFYLCDFLYKGICCGYPFELHRLVDAIQMSTHNICLYKVDIKYTGCNLKTMELLDCALIGVCAVIRSNTVTLLKHANGPEKGREVAAQGASRVTLWMAGAVGSVP